MNFPFGGRIDYAFVKSLFDQHGYGFHVKPYEVNPFGIRNKDLELVDKFNDIIGVAYKDEFLNDQCLVFAGTTKPGLTYLKDKLGNKDGTAILIPGNYPKVWGIGLHNRGTEHEHEAFVQVGKFKVWRDNDSDSRFDTDGKVWDNVTGLNCHRARAHHIDNVGGFSAACQVVEDDKEHSALISIAKRHWEMYATFDYSLFQSY